MLSQKTPGGLLKHPTEGLPPDSNGRLVTSRRHSEALLTHIGSYLWVLKLWIKRADLYTETLVLRAKCQINGE